MDKRKEPFFNASLTFYKKFLQRLQENPNWEELKDEAVRIRDKNIAKLEELADRFEEKAVKAGSKVYRVSTPQEALDIILSILQRREAKLVVKSKSMVTEEIHLNRFLEKNGITVVETDLGELIVQLAGSRPSHLTAPAIHMTRQDIKKLFEEKLGVKTSDDPAELVKVAREKLRECFIKADAGITGANFAIAETGTLVIVSNEGNARLVSSLPPVHIAVITYDKLVETLEEAAFLLRMLPKSSTGQDITAYISFVTGPSRTADIEKMLVLGAHGPEEVHIILLDNGRLKARQDPLLRDVLRCYRCGGCLLVCPVFQEMGGHEYGGDVYPGGIGLLVTAIVNPDFPLKEKLHLCTQCGRCSAFCPMRIDIPGKIKKLREKQPDLATRLSGFFLSSPSLMDKGMEAASRFTSLFRSDFIDLPVIGPVPRREKGEVAERRGEGRRVLLFRGCLVDKFFPSIAEKASKLLSSRGFEVISPEKQSCCGAPAYHARGEEKVRPFMERNLRMLEELEPEAVVFLCPTGVHIFRDVYPELDERARKWAERSLLLSELLVQAGGPEGKERGEVFFHHPCHSMTYLKVKEAPLKLLEQAGFRVKQDEIMELCCGFAGSFAFRHPVRSTSIGERRLRQIDPELTIVTECPGCLFQLSRLRRDRGKVKHIAEILSEE